jgi:hypothetical protein
MKLQGTKVNYMFFTFQANYLAHTADMKYNTDSFLLGINNDASASMTNTKDDFIRYNMTVDFKIKGIRVYVLYIKQYYCTNESIQKWNNSNPKGNRIRKGEHTPHLSISGKLWLSITLEANDLP